MEYVNSIYFMKNCINVYVLIFGCGVFLNDLQQVLALVFIHLLAVYDNLFVQDDMPNVLLNELVNIHLFLLWKTSK